MTAYRIPTVPIVPGSHVSQRCHSDNLAAQTTCSLTAHCIEEIPKYLAKLHSTPETFCSEVEGAKEYHTKLERKKQQDHEKHVNHTWRDD